MTIIKQLKPRDKITQRMTRDGLIEENQTTGDVESVSEREAETDLSQHTATQPFIHPDAAAPPLVPELPRPTGDGTAEKIIERVDTEHSRHKSKRAARRANATAQEGEAARQRPSSRLQFTDEERSAPELQKAIRKSEQKADKLDAARAAVPKKTVVSKGRVFDEATGAGKTRLRFDKVDKSPPKFKNNPLVRPASEIGLAVHGKIHEVEHDNVGVESGHKSEELAEREAGRGLRKAYRNYRLKPYRAAATAERKAIAANVEFAYQKALHDNPALAASNPVSRFWQKQQIKKQYAKAARAAGKAAGATAQTAKKTAEATAKAAKKTAEGTEKTVSFVVRHWKGCLIVLALLLMVVLLIGGLQSCTSMFSGAGSGIVASTYLSDDADILAAEAAYAGMEAELQYELDNYEALHPGYDEYRFDLDDIEHDPYVLASILSALHDGQFTVGEVQGDLAMLFEKQYILTETVETETRYRQETRIGSYPVYDPETGESYTEYYEYEVTVSYTYYIMNAHWENFNLSHVPVYIMGQDTLSKYALYMSTLGNKPELFPSSGYISKYITNPPTAYDVPDEYLTDETFATILTEAEKYLGYPYVWGGSSPATSFDCSGFVSWVLTNTGVCNTGRLGAQGLYNVCTPISAANARPGDLAFFVGTYDTPGVSHVGIYVGDNMMIHAGDPINYSSIDTSYWQSHFYAFGRPHYN